MRMKGYKKALTKSVSLQLRIRGDPGIVLPNNSAVSSSDPLRKTSEEFLLQIQNEYL